MNGSAMTQGLLVAHGASFGAYAEKPLAHGSAWGDALQALAALAQRAGAAHMPMALAQAAEAEHLAAVALDEAAFAARREALRAELARDGLASTACARALGLAAAAMSRTVGLSPYPTQRLAAWVMLQGRFAEMATGEGKTLATALAAGVAALAGVPVHVLTANDYLVQRDQQAMAPFFDRLGLDTGSVLQATPANTRAYAWRHAVVYTTAKELGFDYLKDHHRLRGARDPRLLRAQAAATGQHAQPAVPGLHMVLVDEADSLLLDEACVPLILASRGEPMERKALERAFELSGRLQPGTHFELLPALRRAALREVGRDAVAAAVQGERGLLWPARRAFDLVEAALAARHLLHRDREYAVTPRGVALIDELTGRIAEGRQWSAALHPMVEIKEGLAPSPPNITAAQITYQRLFPRYLRLAGMSGTLLESRHELRLLYGSGVQRVPLGRPSRLRWLGTRLLVDEHAKWAAIVESVRCHAASGRPVLVGTDSVAASHRLSQRLAEAGIAHQVLNAVQDADEAQRIAEAGRAGMVTVATNMAGRGTDIRPDAAARAAGGLHVIAALRNRSRRIDRQLVGRSARHGDPGSAEAIVALDDALLQRFWPASVRRLAAACVRGGCVPGALAHPLLAVAQRAAEWTDVMARRQLRRADRLAQENFGFAGTRE
jgi:preprotein translocase subunit SecA